MSRNNHRPSICLHKTFNSPVETTPAYFDIFEKFSNFAFDTCYSNQTSMKKSYLFKCLPIMAAFFLPASAMAEEFEVDGINYNIEDGVVSVGSNYYAEGDIVIPEKVAYEGEEYPVTAIGEWAFNWAPITSISLPETIESIGQSAFGGCQSLTQIQIPASVKSIGEFAFDNAGLTSVTIPGTVEHLADYAFQQNANLTDCVIEGGVRKVPYSLFANCWSLTNVTLGEGIEEIGDYAFSGQTNIAELNLPSTLKRIGAWAFQFAALTRLTIPANVTYLGDGAFAYNNYVTMTELIIEDSDEPLETDGSPFFSVPVESIYIGRDLSMPLSCDFFPLKEVTTGGSCTRIDGFNFCCYEVERVNLHEGLQIIGQNAISMCDKLTELTIPSTVVTIEDGALNILSALKTLTFADNDQPLVFGSNVLSITNPETIYVGRELEGEQAYFGYSDLKYLTLAGGCKTAKNWMQRSDLLEVTMGEGVERIEDQAFSQCNSLTTVNLSTTLNYIGNEAFEYCPNLSEITLPDGVTYIGDSAFENCPITEVNLTEGLEYLGGWSFAGSKLTEVVIPDGLTQIQWCAFLNCENLRDVTIGKDVIFIDTSAFGGLSSLETLTLEDNDANLGLSSMGVFGGSPMNTLYLGRPVHGSWFLQTELEDATFGGGCHTVSGFNNAPLLKKVSFAETVTSIDEETFTGSDVISEVVCESAVPATLAGNAFTDVVYAESNLCVPSGSEDTYRATEGWSKFIRVNNQTVSVEELDADSCYTVFDMQGRLVKENVTKDEVTTLQSGLYIINGKKVMVK